MGSSTMFRRRTFPALLLAVLLALVPAKEIDSVQDLQQEESASLPAEHRRDFAVGDYDAPPLGHGPHDPNDPWPVGRPEMAKINSLNVKCEKNHMKVHIEFDRAFYGLIFSKGHYSDPNCVHLHPGSGQLGADFDILLGGCGTTSSQQSGYGQHDAGEYIENTIIIQYDPQVQEIWDQARRLRCTWYDYYEKAVTFRPFNVNMLDAVTANFLGDDIRCWMQIQVGKGPWASEVSGIVKIGQTMTMVLAIKDEEHKFDMLVRNCIAHDGQHQPIQLVDEYGCVVRPKIMSPFQKVKNFGASASVVSYAYFQAFKFPDSMSVHFQCVIQVCRHDCPVPQCAGDLGGGYLPAPRDPSGSYTEQKPSYQGHDQAGGSPQPLPEATAKQPPKVPLHDQIPAVAYPAQSGGAGYPLSNVQAHHGGGNEGGEYPVFYNRQGEQLPSKENNVKISGGYGVSGTGGTPRSNDAVRKKRQASEVTDIPTQRVIQVVAPGDVAFTLPNDEKETVVYASRASYDSSSICMSVPGFAAGLVLLLLLLIVSSLVAGFLFLRVRHLSDKDDVSCGYDNTEFVKVAVPIASQ